MSRAGLWSEMREVLRAIGRRFAGDDVMLWASALSYRAIVGLIPLSLLLTGALSFFLRADTPSAELVRWIDAAFPVEQAEAVKTLVTTFLDGGRSLTAFALVGVLVLVLPLCATIRMVIARIFRHDKPTPFFKRLGIDILMVIELTVLVLVSVALSFALGHAQGLVAWMIATIGLDSRWVIGGWGWAMSLGVIVIPAAVSFAVAFQLFWLLPRPRPSVRAAAGGALFMTLTWEASKHLFAFYTRMVSIGARTVRDSIADDVLASVFAVLLGLIAWIYVSACLFIAAAQVTSELSRKHRRARRP